MATKYTTTLSADTSQHNQALKQSAQQVYKYKKQVESAKTTLSGFAKILPQIAAAVGVTTGAMATFKKLIEQTQSATDNWGRFTNQINFALETMANRMSGVGFGNFIDGLKLSAQAAKEAYNALDDLGTMTIFQDKATADYNYQKAQYEKIIKDKKSTKQQVIDAENGLKQLRENYVKGQQALAQQAIKTYQAEMQAIFAKSGVTVTNGFIQKYLGSLAGYNQAAKDFNALEEKMKKNRTWVDDYDINTGLKSGGHWQDTNSAEDKSRRAALLAVIQASDSKLKEANAHYINARNIQTALIQDEISQMRITQAADNRFKDTTSTQQNENVLNSEESPDFLADKKKELDKLNTLYLNNVIRLRDLKENDEIQKELEEQNKDLEEQIRNKIKEIQDVEHTYDTVFSDFPDDGLSIQGSLAFLENELENYIKLREKAVASDSEILSQMYSKFIKDTEEKIKNKKIELGLIDPDKVEEQVEEIKYTITDAYSEIMNLYGNINSLGETLGDVFDSDELKEFFDTLNKGLSVIQAVYSVFESINKVMEISNALKAVSNKLTEEGTAAAVADTAAQTTDASANASNAIAGATKSGAKLPYPMNLIAIATGIAAVVGALSLMGSFADGGIVGGNTTVGDHGLARVNAGEMILNKREQTRLWHNLNGMGNINSGVSGDVVFKISGSDLVGTINNYNNKNRRVR